MHISLDAALQRQPLLSTVGDKLLPTFPGAAAAYSLRALNGDANNVARVRRDGDDAELDFTAEGVSFELEDWVNGKLEDTLPADVATAAAAYSLRKVRDAYTGNAVQIRRPSDNVEVNVAFDANNEVSASSAISNVEDIELVSESGFATDTGGFASSISGATFTFGNTLDGKDNVLFATFDGSGLLGLNFSTSDVAIGDVVTYSFDVYWASTNTGGLPDLRIRSGNTTIGHSDVPMPSEDSWYTFSGQFTVTSNTPTALTFIAADSSGLTTGDVFAIANGSYGKQQDAGDTTATTLGGFLTEATPARNRTGSARYDTLTPDGTTGFTAVTNNIAACGFDIAGTSGTAVQVSFDITLNSGTVSIKLRPDFETGSDVSNDETITTSGSKSFTLTSTADFKAMLFITASADYVVSNFSVNVPYNHDAYVVTWYDQSVNGYDATQDTAGDQPKIAEAGSLLDDIDFAGSKYLQTTSLQEQIPVSFFCVNRFDSTLTGFRPFIGNGVLDGSSQGYGLFYNDPSNTFRTQVRIPSVSSNVDNTATTVGGVNSLTTAFMTASTITSFYNGGNETSGANAQGAITPNRTLTLGGSETGVTPTVTRFFEGGISEVILYSSDQSDNRFKIESNINNHYGIYTPAEDGFVETWYDQSGNGNHASQSAVEGYQPKIVSNGNIITEGSNIAIEFNGVDTYLETGAVGTSSDFPLATFAVFNRGRDSDSVARTPASSLDRGAFGRASGYTWHNTYFANGSPVTITTIPVNQQIVASGLGGSATNQNSLDGGIVLGGEVAGYTWLDGTLQEFVVYTSDQSANRPDIESNIADEYGITLS
jgi:hypothetical protein